MELSMLRETNDDTLLPSITEVNGCDTNMLNVGPDTNGHNTMQTQEVPIDKITDEAASASIDASNRLKCEDKTIMHDSMQAPSTPKAGASPPTEHKQHMHLPLRKRHLLASSTGSQHNDNSLDNNFTPTHSIVHSHDSSEASTNNTHHDQAHVITTKPIDSTPTELTEPLEPPEPPEMLSNINKSTLTEPLHDPKVANGDNTNTALSPHITKHEPKELHENNNVVHTGHSLAHDLHASNPPLQPNHNQRPQFTKQYSPHTLDQPQHNVYQQTPQPVQPLHSPHSSPRPQNSHTHSRPPSSHTQTQQPKPPPTHHHNSPATHNSPIRTQSPTRAPSPSPQPAKSPVTASARHSSSRGRGTGRGRSKTSKAEGLSTSTTNTTNSSSEEELYCFCRRPYDPTVDVFMICCDSCDEWYHGSCVGVNQREAKKIARYVCPRCKKMPTSPATTSATSSEVSSEGEPSTPPPTKNKKRKNEASFKTEPKRQAISPETVSDNGVELTIIPQTYEESRYCLNCNKQAIYKSKYCGPECGLEYARKQFHNNGSKKPSAAEIGDKEALDEIARKKADIVDKLNKLAQEQRDLEKAMQFAKKMDASAMSNVRSTSPTAADADELASKNHILPSENTTIDCISCGHPIAVSKYTLHMERCYHKKENNVLMVGSTSDGGTIYCNAYDSKTKTFCKKLKNACTSHAVKRNISANGHDAGPSDSAGANGNGAITNLNAARRSTPQTCGCPTGDFQSGYCELTRKACVKHHNWEDLGRDSISNQRTQHNKILAGLEAEEHAVRLRMARRSQAAVSDYRTIEEA